MAEFRDSIVIAASCETVFEYLTTSSGIDAWLGQRADLQPAVGGRFAVDVAGYPVRGEYLHLEPPHRVVITWGFPGNDDLPAGASTVEFRLTATDSGTRVDLHHAGLPDTGLPGIAAGWRNYLPRLAVAANGEELKPDMWQPLSSHPPQPEGDTS